MSKNLAHARSAGRPAIPTLVVTLPISAPKSKVVRMDAANLDVISPMYLNRAALKAAGIPDGFVPSEIEVTIRVTKTKAEEAAA